MIGLNSSLLTCLLVCLLLRSAEKRAEAAAAHTSLAKKRKASGATSFVIGASVTVKDSVNNVTGQIYEMTRDWCKVHFPDGSSRSLRRSELELSTTETATENESHGGEVVSSLKPTRQLRGRNHRIEASKK